MDMVSTKMAIVSREFKGITAFQYRDMRAWCYKRWGPGGYGMKEGEHQLLRWDSWSYCDNLKSGQMMKWRGEAFFDFADEKDAMWFALVWP